MRPAGKVVIAIAAGYVALLTGYTSISRQSELAPYQLAYRTFPAPYIFGPTVYRDTLVLHVNVPENVTVQIVPSRGVALSPADGGFLLMTRAPRGDAALYAVLTLVAAATACWYTLSAWAARRGGRIEVQVEGAG